MKIHKHHLIGFAAVNLGASSHFYSIDYTGEQDDPTVDPIHVNCDNKKVMVSLAKDIIQFNKHSLAAKNCHKFKISGCHCYF